MPLPTSGKKVIEKKLRLISALITSFGEKNIKCIFAEEFVFEEALFCDFQPLLQHLLYYVYNRLKIVIP